MTANYEAAVTALSSNEELRKKVLSATSAEERAGHLRDAGLDIPTHEEINSRHSDLADVTGAGTGTGAATEVGGGGMAAVAIGAAAAV
jgi:hypothetical protein